MSKRETWKAHAISQLGNDTLSTARKGLSRLKDPGLAQALARTGLGNHKAVIEAIAQVERDLASTEGDLPGSDPVANRMFPNSK